MRFLSHVLWLAMLLGIASSDCSVAQESSVRPNILWIIVDDMSPSLSCYGEKAIVTPNLDRLASQGIRFEKAFVTAPVCSPCRSALITGCYQTTIGAHHHRSGRGTQKIVLPQGIVPAPKLFRDAGYFTSICSWPPSDSLGKTDYNFQWDTAIYDAPDWSKRKPGQPFFAQVQLHGGKHRDGRGLSQDVKMALGTLTDPASVHLPPYYPDDPVIRQDWAAYLDAVRFTDLQVGEIMARLEKDGVADSTYVFFMTDHGISHARGKQFLYDEGTHVPFIVRGPGLQAGSIRAELIEHIDLMPTSLALAGLPIPEKIQGRDIFDRTLMEREFVFAARDRCDETVEHLRSVRSKQFKLIRNYLYRRPHLQPNHYKDHKPTYVRLRQLHAEDRLPALPEQLLFSPERSPFELYDLENDPWETRNLADDPSYAEVLRKMQGELARWETETGDLGREPESEEMYDSDMEVYLNDFRRSKAPAIAEFDGNIRLMKQWKAEGR